MANILAWNSYINQNWKDLLLIFSLEFSCFYIIITLIISYPLMINSSSWKGRKSRWPQHGLNTSRFWDHDLLIKKFSRQKISARFFKKIQSKNRKISPKTKKIDSCQLKNTSNSPIVKIFLCLLSNFFSKDKIAKSAKNFFSKNRNKTDLCPVQAHRAEWRGFLGNRSSSFAPRAIPGQIAGHEALTPG